jgi:hypothetical protein
MNREWTHHMPMGQPPRSRVHKSDNRDVLQPLDRLDQTLCLDGIVAVRRKHCRPTSVQPHEFHSGLREIRGAPRPHC